MKSNEASKKGLSLSLFERVEQFKVKASTMLDEQYRMNEQIMKWSSDAMYEGELKADPHVRDRILKDIYRQDGELINNPLMIIDTAGALMYEGIDEQSENESKYNQGECDLVI